MTGPVTTDSVRELSTAETLEPLSRPAALPVLPWIVLPAIAVAAWVPWTGEPWWCWVAALVATLAVVVLLTVLTVPGRWRGPALLPAAILMGLAWGAQTRPVAAGPALVELQGRVVAVYRSGHTQGVRLRDVRGNGVGSSLSAVVPPVPGLLPGDVVQLRGRWHRDERGDQVRAVTAERLVPREGDVRAGAWAAIERLGPQRELAATLLLGAGSPPERRDFRQAGLAHVLAVSGLHLGIAAALAWWLLRQARLPWLWRILALLVLVAGYAWLTGGAPATRRAAAMVAVATAAAVLGREPHRLGLLAGAAGLLVVLDPVLVHDLGFQLSLLAVFGILTWGMELVAWRTRVLPLQPWPLDRRAWRACLWSTRAVADGLAIGVAASLAVAPVVAAVFTVGNPWSPVATVLAAPLVTVVLWLGLPWLLVNMVWAEGPWAGISGMLDAVLAGLANIAHWSAQWPGAHLTVAAPPLPVLLVTPVVLVAWPLRHQAWWRALVGSGLVVWWWVYAR